MSTRGKIGIGTALGLVWAMGVLSVGGAVVTLPVFTLMPTIMTAFLAPGLVMLAMVGRIAQRRFFDETLIDGGPATGAAETDGRVLQNTVEQLVLALAIWPAAAVLLAGKGPGLIMTLGVAFVIARLVFWIGYHRSPLLRAFGFAATFCPTALVAIWAIWNAATGFQ
ncbi:MAPEG family protein [Roseovarius aestuariivivens]|uniref:MAPEG family protein n=1 Tax=Roseovarius aestuariivivens TaxID=1888910 RepID=UPI001080B3F2|nr:MAPEG family protein [Roseovarius aestuariivivens]